MNNNTFKIGQAVSCNGSIGTVIAVLPNTMLEVRLARGVVCVDFSDVKTPINLNDPFVVLTGTSEKFGCGRTHTNSVRNTELAAMLSTLEIPFESCTGFWQNVDQGESFICPGLSLDRALALARLFEQESICTSTGIVYTDGRYSPAARGLIQGFAARQFPGWTKLADGRCFSYVA